MKSNSYPLDLGDAQARVCFRVFQQKESLAYFKSLYFALDWQERTIKLFGRTSMVPRLSIWYGDNSYSYSGNTWPQRNWPHVLVEIRKRVEDLAGQPFNGVLANLYRDGRDSMGWHSDDEPELGENPVIASVVFGATRRFLFRNKKDKSQRLEVPLADGDVLIMGSRTQANWTHAIPKTSKLIAPRINLTFRQML